VCVCVLRRAVACTVVCTYVCTYVYVWWWRCVAAGVG